MKVLVNDEEQYSLWPSYLDVPAGWKETGTEGTREKCLEYVNEVWVDMRPRSLREQMERTAP
ncbi:MbtH family protein [Streptomyces sp. NPDC050560]|uniref:MbtH family protein n=1 Tax=Streptomyces sp. NPDC050560 TaxID=3365630 RepID=UPI0037A8177D